MVWGTPLRRQENYFRPPAMSFQTSNLKAFPQFIDLLDFVIVSR